MEGLLLAQGFDAARAPSLIEFALLNAESRRETHQSGANESAAESRQARNSKRWSASRNKPANLLVLITFVHTQKGSARPASD